ERRPQPRLRDPGRNASRIKKEPDQRVERVIERRILGNGATPGLIDALATHTSTHGGDGVSGPEGRLLNGTRIVGPLQAWQGSQASHRLWRRISRLILPVGLTMRQMQPVLWTKGLVLSPQHLQIQDRYYEDLIDFRLNMLTFSPWGFQRLAIDR